MKWKTAAISLGLLLGLIGTLLSLDVGVDRDPSDPNLFQFVRIRYNGYTRGFGFFRMGQVPPWMHDYPRAEKNFLKILLEVTGVETTPDSHLILDLDDPRILEYPFLYVSEPGYWNITAAEASNLREFMQRGGFVVFDDFRGRDELNTLISALSLVAPEYRFEELTVDHPIFQCFYDIESLHMVPPYDVPGPPTFYGWFNPEGDLQAIANFNNDIGDYWEWSDEAINPIAYSNEAYKFGINYVIFALTH